MFEKSQSVDVDSRNGCAPPVHDYDNHPSQEVLLHKRRASKRYYSDVSGSSSFRVGLEPEEKQKFILMCLMIRIYVNVFLKTE